VQQQQQLAALDTTIVISNQRLALAQNRFTIEKQKCGSLNAQVDLNTDKVAVLRQNELYANTKILLNQILARDSKTDFSVISELTLDGHLMLSELKALATHN
jgi:hypothetical protein